MAPYRRYKKRYYKYKSRNYRRGKYSRYGTYKNRSSTAQASQIYGLSRRITRIESDTKPEYIQMEQNGYAKQIVSNTDQNVWTTLENYNITSLQHSTTIGGTLQIGFGDLIVNKTARVFKVIVWGTLEREVDPSQTDMFDRDTSCYVRLALCQYNAVRYADITPAEIFEYNSGPTSYNAPLKKGCATHAKILKVINLKITGYDPNIINFKRVIRIRNKIVHKDDNENARLKNGLCLVGIGLRDKGGPAAVTNRYFVNLKAKAIYTDA